MTELIQRANGYWTDETGRFSVLRVTVGYVVHDETLDHLPRNTGTDVGVAMRLAYEWMDTAAAGR